MTNRSYEAVSENANNPIADIVIENNTDDNYIEQAKERGINIDFDEQGNPIRYYVNKEVTIETPDGPVSVTIQSDLNLVRSEESTAENEIYVYREKQADYNYQAGSSVAYMNRDEYIKGLAYQLGYELDPTQMEIDTFNTIFNQTYPFDSGWDELNTALIRTANAYVGNIISTDDESLYELYKALFLTGAVPDFYEYIDDEVFKYQMQHASVGDFFQADILSWGIKDGHPRHTNADTILDNISNAYLCERARRANYNLFGHDPDAMIVIDFSVLEWCLNNDPGAVIDGYVDRINDVLQNHHNVTLNGIAANMTYFSGYGHGNYAQQINIIGLHISDNNQIMITHNYPERGYALSLQGTIGVYATSGAYGDRYDTYQAQNYYYNVNNKNVHSAGATGANIYGNNIPLIIVYDHPRFYNYVMTCTMADYDSNINNCFFINVKGRVVRTIDVDGITVKDNPVSGSIETISEFNNKIEEVYPDWFENTSIEVTYNPVTKEEIAKHYYNYTIVESPDDDPHEVKPINPIYITYPEIQMKEPEVYRPYEPPHYTAPKANRFFTVYKPSELAMNELGAYMWNPTALEQLLSIFQNPTDGIIGFHKLFLEPTVGEIKSCVLGTLNTHIGMLEVSDYTIIKDFGNVSIPLYFEDERDYTETSVSIYIPFIGFRDLNVCDIIGNEINLAITCDVTTGQFLAELRVTKNGSIMELLYQFEGNCSIQLPITSSNKARMMASVVQSTIGTGAAMVKGGMKAGKIGVLGGAVSGAINGASGLIGTGYNICRSGSLTSQGGALTFNKFPYILVSRSIPTDPIYSDIIGFNTIDRARLGDLSGMTVVSDIHLDVADAELSELQEIERLLKAGVIL